MKNHYLDNLSPCLTTGDRLHFEILDFFNFMTPMPFEEEMRHRVVNKLKTAIHKYCKSIKVRPFGSYVTGLYLPSRFTTSLLSDIDISIDGTVPENKFNAIFDILVNDGVALPDDIKIINNTKIPLIKYTDCETRINLDISFNNNSGTGALEFVQHQLKMFPNIAPLYLLIRQILINHNLSEVYHGGLGSYSLFLILVSFFQRHPRPDARSHRANLGVLLIEFFELYGLHFRYDRTAISVKGNGGYFSRNPSTPDSYDFAVFELRDPNDERSFRMGEIKQIFMDCYNEVSRYYENASLIPKRMSSWNISERLLLNKIVFVPPEIQLERQRLYYIHQSVISTHFKRFGNQSMVRRYSQYNQNRSLNVGYVGSMSQQYNEQNMTAFEGFTGVASYKK